MSILKGVSENDSLFTYVNFCESLGYVNLPPWLFHILLNCYICVFCMEMLMPLNMSLFINNIEHEQSCASIKPWTIKKNVLTIVENMFREIRQMLTDYTILPDKYCPNLSKLIIIINPSRLSIYSWPIHAHLSLQL